MNGWLIFLGLLGAYMLLLFWLVRTGRMQRWNLSLLLGFILMIRTQRGRRSLEIVATPKRFWNVFGDVGIVLGFVGMAAMTLLMLALIPTVLNPDSGVEALGASEILVIPGVNPFVPLWYGIIALIVTLVVHEGGHGILAIANKMRVKSLGLLYAIVPVGAFVEPDEDDLMESPRRARLRVYAAGPAVNVAVAAITVAMFAVMVSAAAAIPGAPLVGVVEDQPAHDAGILPGDIIIQAARYVGDLTADGHPTGPMMIADPVEITHWEAFTDYMRDREPDDRIAFTMDDGDIHVATLTSTWKSLTREQQERVLEENATLAEDLQDDAFLGVRTIPGVPVQELLSQPLGNKGTNMLLFLYLPLGEIRGTPYLGTYLPDFHTTPWNDDIYWPAATLLFWIFWINLMVGLTNILPMLPLDGGHLFRDGVGGVVERMRPNIDPEVRDRIVGRMASTISLVIFGAFLLQIFGPRLAQAFA